MPGCSGRGARRAGRRPRLRRSAHRDGRQVRCAPDRVLARPSGARWGGPRPRCRGPRPSQRIACTTGDVAPGATPAAHLGRRGAAWSGAGAHMVTLIPRRRPPGRPPRSLGAGGASVPPARRLFPAPAPPRAGVGRGRAPRRVGEPAPVVTCCAGRGPRGRRWPRARRRVALPRSPPRATAGGLRRAASLCLARAQVGAGDARAAGSRVGGTPGRGVPHAWWVKGLAPLAGPWSRPVL